VAVAWADHAPGDEVSAADHPGINFPALVDGGVLEEITPRVPCPACEADRKVRKAPTFEKPETLADHYQEEHPALATPDYEGLLNGEQERIS
jgi:hypothetical protein